MQVNGGDSMNGTRAHRDSGALDATSSGASSSVGSC